MHNLSNKKTRSTAIPSLLCDFYKTSHQIQYPENSQFLYSIFTPRSNANAPFLTQVVSFGFQAFIKKYLIHYFNDNFFTRPQNEVVSEYTTFIADTLQISDNGEHIAQLHQLGYLPIRIKAFRRLKSQRLCFK